MTLRLANRPGDTTPRWQSLGTIKVAEDRPFKVVVAGPEEPGKPAPPARKKTGSAEKKQRTPRPVPALLSLVSRTDSGAASEINLDLIRGRLDTIAPSPDRRRGEVRTNQQGADFQAPPTAEAWRDRAAHLREQLLVTLGLWPMFPKT